MRLSGIRARKNDTFVVKRANVIIEVENSEAWLLTAAIVNKLHDLTLLDAFFRNRSLERQ